MTILFDATVFVNISASFGLGIIPVETPAERHKRETFQIIDAVSEGRAFQLPVPIGSPNYRSFVQAMNAPATPVRKPRFEPTDADWAWLREDSERREFEEWVEAMERAAQEAEWSDRMSGYVLEDEMLAIGACG